MAGDLLLKWKQGQIWWAGLKIYSWVFNELQVSKNLHFFTVQESNEVLSFKNSLSHKNSTSFSSKTNWFKNIMLGWSALIQAFFKSCCFNLISSLFIKLLLRCTFGNDSILDNKMANIGFLQLLQYEHLLMFSLLYDCWLNIFWIWGCWPNKTGNLRAEASGKL